MKVISGDNARSVGAVAASLGLGSVENAVDGRQLPKETDELAEVVTDGTVFGRIRPDQKRAMVKALQSRHNTVAMTGDGVNDVLALKDADIGVAMGSGSSAARSVAQIVLLDNKFATLPYVVGEGRRVIGNIERVANLFLTKTVYAVLLALLVGIAGSRARSSASRRWPTRSSRSTSPSRRGSPSASRPSSCRWPRTTSARTGFVKRVLTHAVPNGIIVGLVTFITFVLVNPGGSDGPRLGIEADHVPPAVAQASTATLMALIATAFYVLVVVARPYTWWKIALLVVSALAYVVIFTWHQTQEWFNLDSSNWGNNAVGLGLAVVGMVAIEVVNRLIPDSSPRTARWLTSSTTMSTTRSWLPGSRVTAVGRH